MILPKLGENQHAARQSAALVVLLVLMLPSAWLAYTYLSSPTPKEQNDLSNSLASGSTADTSTSGDGNASIAGIGSIGGDLTVTIAPTPTQSEQEAFEFVPIPRLQERLDQVRFSETGPVQAIRFVSDKWGIDHKFRIPMQTPPWRITMELLDRLAFKEHLKVNLTKFPTPPGCFWLQNWTLCINGIPIPREDAESPIGELVTSDTDTLSFTVYWGTKCQTSSGGDGEAVDDTQVFERPPAFQP